MENRWKKLCNCGSRRLEMVWPSRRQQGIMVAGFVGAALLSYFSLPAGLLVVIALLAISLFRQHLYLAEYRQSVRLLRDNRQLLCDVIEMHEREQKLAAYDIHDGLAQQLAGAIFKFQAVEPLRTNDPRAAGETFGDAMHLLQEAMVETRRLISGMRPPVLDESGIVAAVECLASECRQNNGVAVDFVHPQDFPRLSPSHETAVFRTVQECLNNACRHGRAKKIYVELQTNQQNIRIDVEDDGVGFEPSSVGRGHYGLQGIRERAMLLNGVAVVESSPGHGVRIHVELPLESPGVGEAERAPSTEINQPISS